jgi:hypothetical protein
MRTDDVMPATGGVLPPPVERKPWHPGPLVSFTEAFARRDLRAAGLVAVVTAVLGVPLGLVWAAVAPHVSVLVTPEGAVFADHRPESFVAADALFGAVGIAAGAVLGGAVFGWRRRRGPWLAIALAAGSLAGSYVAWKTGHQMGLSTYNRLLGAAPAGRAFERPVDVRARGVLFVQPIVAVIVYVLAAGWSRFGDLGRVSEAAGPGAGAGPGRRAGTGAGAGGAAVSSGSAAPAAPPAEPAPPRAGGASSPPA